MQWLQRPGMIEHESPDSERVCSWLWLFVPVSAGWWGDWSWLHGAGGDHSREGASDFGWESSLGHSI